MTLRRAAWLCLLTGFGLAALGWLAWDRDYLFPLGAAAFLAVMSSSHLFTAANQMPGGEDGDEEGAS